MKFTKVFWAALLAVVVGSILSGLFWLFTIIGLVGSASVGSGSNVAVLPNSILKIDLADNITDSPNANPFASINLMSMQSNRSFTLLQTLRALEAAAADERIEGIYLNFSSTGSVSTAIMEELRAALITFKQSGKFIVAFNDGYSQGSYYLASVADKIYLQPEGGFDWSGMANTLIFFKGAMDKLGIECEVFRPTVCKYKSAVEPYILKKMSEPNRQQNQAYINSMWSVICQAVSESRNISVEQLNKIANTTPLMNAQQALENKLIDGIIYRDQMNDYFAEKGVEKSFTDEYSMISLGDYCSTIGNNPKKNNAPQIGIVYADGEIVDGESDGMDSKIYGTTLANTIAKARKDENVKAVVLRVNSPGGSALASDIIWREVELLKAEKPVIVSMGSYAASGGYYISAPADAIVANKLTLTGSIGVFGMFMQGGQMLSNKLGITFDGVKTNKHSDFGQSVMGFAIRPSDATEKALLIKSVDQVYEAFTSKVAAGRNLELQKVLDIAEGRVWSGTDAVNIGLADANGGLTAALAIAADKAGIADNYQVTEVLNEENEFAAIMKALGMQARTALIGEELANVCNEYEALKAELTRNGIQAYCPYRVSF